MSGRHLSAVLTICVAMILPTAFKPKYCSLRTIGSNDVEDIAGRFRPFPSAIGA